VSDNGGTSSSDEIIIKITNTDGSNNAPVVTLGTGYSMFDGEGTSVTAKVIDSDELDDIASLQWSQVDNSGLVLPLNNATSLTVSFIAPNVSSDTVFTLRLTATDSRGSSGYSDISITIKRWIIKLWNIR
jgi:bifunctional chitinase/lysozyme